MTRDRVYFSKIAKIERLNDSRNGNPRFRVALELPDGTWWTRQTESDASVNYGIENPEFRDTPVWVDFNGSGKISHIKVA
jgi:hypothetical protein